MDDAELVATAAAYAREVHAHDVRKGTGVSYFEGHLAPVAAIVADAGGDAMQVAAAYLHDTAEDHGGERRLADLRVRFGDGVAGIVADLSDSLVDTEAGEAKRPWRERKEQYLASLATKPIPSLEVAAADKLHNARSIVGDLAEIGDAVWERFTTGRAADQVWYYGQLVATLAERLPDHATVARLRAAVAELTRLATSEPGT